MNLSSPFIRRPVATSLIAAAFLRGRHRRLLQPAGGGPAAGGLPDLQVSASLPGASPETMASNVATPLERQFSLIPGITQMTSVSSLGSTSITLQFELSRNIDAAAQDVQAAINAASGQLPTNLPAPPTIRKVNPADAPIMILALSSDTLPIATVRRLRRQHPRPSRSRASTASAWSTSAASRSRPCASSIDPRKVAALGLQLDTVRATIANNTVNAPKGAINGPAQKLTVYANDQILDAAAWNNLVVGYHNGAPIRVSDLGGADRRASRTTRSAPGSFPGKANTDKTLKGGRAILLIVFKQPGANVIKTVDRINAGPARAAGQHPAGHRRPRRGRPHPDHPRLGQGRGDHPADHHRPGGGGDLPVPAQRPRHPDPQRGDPAVPAGHRGGDAAAAASASTTCR